MKAIHLLVGAVIFSVTTTAQSGNRLLTNDLGLLGEFTQNAPCSSDGSDPVELKVKISTDQIDSNAGICKILDATPEGPDGKIVKMHVQCQLLVGPLVGDITFTQNATGTVDFIDSSNNYAATLYRCRK